jgi:hypothetical protein
MPGVIPVLRGAIFRRPARTSFAALSLLLLALLVAMGLRLNAAAMVGSVGVVSFLYLLSFVGTALSFARAEDWRARIDRLPKAFAGLHLLVLVLFAPLWARGNGSDLTLRLAVLSTPLAAYLIWGFARLGRTADWLADLLEVVVPQRMARLLAAEIRILAMALFAWGARRRQVDEPSFTSGAILVPVLISVAVLGIAESAALELIVGRRSHIGASVLIAIGLFTFVYMVGLAKSLKYMPTVLMPHALLIRLGHFHAVEIPYETIDAVKRMAPGAKVPPKSLNLAALSAPNLLIGLAAERELIGMAGRKRVFRHVAVRMDDVESFEACLCNLLELEASATRPEPGPAAAGAIA